MTEQASGTYLERFVDSACAARAVERFRVVERGVGSDGKFARDDDAMSCARD